MTEQAPQNREPTGTGDWIAGDRVGGDKIGRDKIAVSDVSGSYIAIGDGAQTIVHHIQQATSAIDELNKGIQVAERQLADAIQAKISRYTNLSERLSTAALANPYKALLDYQVEDAPFFYGRASAIQAMNQCLTRGRLTILHSESGSGKSSLLQAGLATRLLAEGNFPLYLRPYRQSPAQAIRRAFLPDYASRPELGRFHDDRMSLRGFLEQVTHYLGGRTLFIFLDQFEEFFTEVRPELQSAFAADLQNCVESDLNVWWVLSVRKEYFSDLRLFHTLKPFDNEYFLPSFSLQEAREVITEPAARQGVRFEAGLVEDILADLSQGQVGIQPAQVQLVCYTLFEELPAEAGEIGRALYLKPRGRGAGTPAAAGILTSHLSRVLDRELKGQERQVARRLLEALVTSEQRRARRDRDSLAVELDEVPPGQLDHVLETLYRNRLVRRETDEADRPVYELTHDYLLGEIDLDPETRARKAAQEILDHEVVNWQVNPRLRIPADKLDIIEAQEEQLILSSQAHELLTLSRQALQRRRRFVFAGGGAVVVLLIATVVLIIISLGAQAAAQTARNEIATATVELAGAAAQQAAAEATVAALGREGASINLALQSLDSSDPEQALVYALQAVLSLDSNQVSPWQTYRALFQSLDNPLRRVMVAEEDVLGLAFDPDSGTMLTSFVDKTQVWSLETGQVLQTFEHDQEFAMLTKPVAISTDGAYILDSCSQGKICWWSKESGELVRTQEYEGMVDTIVMTVSPETGFLLASDGQLTASLWSLETGELLDTLEHEGQSFQTTGAMRAMVLSPDGQLALTASGLSRYGAGEARLWSLENGEPLYALETDGPVNAVAFSPDSEWAVTGSEYGSLRLWSVETGQELRTLDNDLPINLVAVSPDGEYILSGSGNSVRLWSVETGRIVTSLEHGGRVVAFNPTGELVFTSSASIIRAWSSIPGSMKYSKEEFGRLQAITFSPDHKYILTGETNGESILWLAGTRQVLWSAMNEGSVSSATFSPDGSLAFTGTTEGELSLWSVETGQALHTSHLGVYVPVAEFSPDGSQVLLGLFDGSVWTWSVDTGGLRQILDQPMVIHSITFSPGGEVVVAGDSARNVEVWSAETGQILQAFTRSDPVTPSITAAAVSPTGDLVFVGAGSLTKLWSVESGQPLLSLLHDGTVHSMAISPDNEFALTGSVDGQIQVWSIETGLLVYTFDLGSPVIELAFSPDGSYLTAGGGDGAAAIWLFGRDLIVEEINRRIRDEYRQELGLP